MSDDESETDAESDAEERTVIRTGRDFEQEYRLDAREADKPELEIELPGRTDERAPRVE